MKDIMLKITGKTISALPKNPDDPNNQNNTIELVTAGKYSHRGDITRISYDESDLSGMEGCQTQITINGNKLKMQRSGANLNFDSMTEMEFEAGKRYEGEYVTPYGNIGMEILTNQINLEGEESPQKISIDYSLTLKGIVESRNKLEIEVLQ